MSLCLNRCQLILSPQVSMSWNPAGWQVFCYYLPMEKKRRSGPEDSKHRQWWRIATWRRTAGWDGGQSNEKHWKTMLCIMHGSCRDGSCVLHELRHWWWFSARVFHSKPERSLQRNQNEFKENWATGSLWVVCLQMFVKTHLIFSGHNNILTYINLWRHK